MHNAALFQHGGQDMPQREINLCSKITCTSKDEKQ